MPSVPTYPWSCLSCGHTNPSRADLCSTCSCPAHATSKQIDANRAAHLARGGQLQHQAAVDAADEHLSGVDILVRPVLFLFLGTMLTNKLVPRRNAR